MIYALALRPRLINIQLKTITKIRRGFDRELTKRGIDFIDKYPKWPQSERACTSFAPVWAKYRPSLLRSVTLFWCKNHVSLKKVSIIYALIF